MGRQQEYVPTQEEIAQACVEIRSGWDAATLRCRRQFVTDLPRPKTCRRTGIHCFAASQGAGGEAIFVSCVP